MTTPQARQQAPTIERPRLFAALMATISMVVLAVWSLPAVFFKLHTIPSTSMHPTIRNGDIVIRSTTAYFAAKPERGDVVIFSVARDDGTLNYVKRVIGMPGDVVQMQAGVLVINGTPVPKRLAGSYRGSGELGDPLEAPCWVETLPNGVTYSVLDLEQRGMLDDTAPTIVPAGHYFLLGDNRDNSIDSRLFPGGGLGVIAEAQVIGRVDRLLFAAHAHARGSPRFGAEVKSLGCAPEPP